MNQYHNNASATELILITTIKRLESWIIREISVNNHRMPLQSWSHTRLTFILLLFPSPPIASFPHFMSFGTSIIDHWETKTAPPLLKHTSLAVYSVTLCCALSANTHRRSSLRMKESNGCDLPVFSALERFHFIVMETQSGETSSCQGSADTQDLWWKITDVKIKRVQSHPETSYRSNTQQSPSKHLKSQYITPKTSFSWQADLHYHAHLMCHAKIVNKCQFF